MFDTSLFRRIAEWELKHGFSRNPPTGKFIRTTTTEDYRKRDIRLFVFSPDVFVHVNKKDNRVQKLTRLSRNETNTPDHAATWSKTDAIRLAREAATIIMGDFPEVVAEPEAAFSPAQTSKGRAYWRVFWHRSSRDGYTWVLEGIGLELHEDHGLEAFYDNRWSEFTEPEVGAQMRGPAELEAKAREFASAIQRKDHDYSNLLKLVGSEVRVIEPNSYGRPVDVVASLKKGRQAAIARVFIFEQWRPSGQQMRGHLIIYVDPFTGESLGGDFD